MGSSIGPAIASAVIGKVLGAALDKKPKAPQIVMPQQQQQEQPPAPPEPPPLTPEQQYQQQVSKLPASQGGPGYADYLKQQAAIANAATAVKTKENAPYYGGGDKSPAPAPPPTPVSMQPDLSNFSYPELMQTPNQLASLSSMDPLQQRSRIATLATQGVLPGSNSAPILPFYTNVLQRSLVDPGTGGIRSGASILPIEAQYAKQVLGRELQDPITPENFLTQLLGMNG